MYCKNCGHQMDPNAVICVNCGVSKGTGANFCPNCGSAVTPGTSFCQNCGYSVRQAPTYAPGQQKSKLVAGLLGILIGSLGIHNFYLGYTGKAVAQLLIALLTCGFGAVITYIWGLIEGIMILTGSINVDGKGIPLAD